MAASHLIRLGKIKGEIGVLSALKHNKRTLQTEKGAGANIDAKRTPLNYSLINDDAPEKIARFAKSQMILAGIENPRKDAVRAVEVVFSLPIDRHNQNTKQFFCDCCEWTKKTFAGELLSFDVHLDESAPHAHAVILPLIEGKLNGNSMIGGTGNLMRLINLFHKEVGKNYGLSRNENRLSANDKEILAKHVMAKLQSDSVMQSNVYPVIRDLIFKDPLPFSQLLSIQLEKPTSKTNKSFVDIKRSHGKGSFVT